MLKFSLLRVPVTVHPTFLIIALFGLGGERRGLSTTVWLVAWVSAVFVAVLIHEMGHALTARAFGGRGISVTLFALGGVTSWMPPEGFTPWRRFVVSASGSGPGVLLGLLIWYLVANWAVPPDPYLAFAESFVWASLVWGVLNWIPIRRLDGGQMLEALFEMWVPRSSVVVARVVSVAAGVGAALVGWSYGFRFGALFAILLILPDLTDPWPTRKTAGGAVEPDSAGLEKTEDDATNQPSEPREPPAFPI